jgi:lysophospholipase L1-like esterase
MNLLTLLAFTIYAAETVISPIPDDIGVATPPPAKPDISFGQIVTVPTPMPEVLGITTIAPTPTPILAKKKSYTIALLGDSMIDTLGPGIPALQTDLKNMYPGTSFTLLNYGDGGTNIDFGIDRIINSYTYLGNHIPSLASTHPDIVVLESFAYNPFPVVDGVDRHWLALARAVDTIHQYVPGAKIIIAATIAPNSMVFGDGAAGLAFSAQDKIERTTVIKQYLDSTVKFAIGEHLPLADAYHASLTANGEGKLTYINGGDHIHYSDAGRALFAKKLSDVIVNNRLLE